MTNSRKDDVPAVCMMSNMTGQNLLRIHVHCPGAKHSQASNPGKLSLKENQVKRISKEKY